MNNTLKKLFQFFVVLSSLSALSQISFGKPQKINSDWKFILQDNSTFKASSCNDATWTQVSLPHDWSVKQPLNPLLASATGYLPGGIAWYRKSLNIPLKNKGEKVYLYFEGVYNRSEVYINGKLLGKRPNGYISFAYDATPYINYGENNTIAVRVDHSKSADSRWYTGSGIYRNVWVVYASPIHISQWGVYAFPEVNKDSAVLYVEVSLDNDSKEDGELTVINKLFSPSGELVVKSSNKLKVTSKESRKISLKLEVNQPKLWDLDQPNLYELKTEVLKNGKVIDQTTTQTGFRKFTFNPDKGFALNDKWIKMKGVCLHHDAGVLGSAVPREVWNSRLETLKSIGVNAIRTSHNPQSPDFYSLCDELGLLVLNEVYDEWEHPKRKWLEGWNKGTPGYQGSFDIFKDWAEKDLEDVVRRDRNHLSVFAWSIGNEVDYPNDPYSHPVLDGGKNTGFSQAIYGGYKKDAPNAMRLGNIAKRLVSAVKKHDKSRPTTAGLAGVAMSNETEYPSALDITGYNYTESKYKTDHEKYPNRVIYGSENRHDLKAWLAVKNNEHIFGQFLWTGIDYLGESGKWPSRGFNSGLVDFSGNIKPRGYFRQSLWSNKPMMYLGTYRHHNKWPRLSKDAWAYWNYKEGQNIRVVCYTNAAKAHLELNGEIVGEEKSYDKETGIISWDIKYKPGKLEAVGFNINNKEISRYIINSSNQPYALNVKQVDNTDKGENKDEEIEQLIVEVVDENNNPVLFSKNDVTCKITGSAELLGLEAGNNSDMADYTDNTHSAFRGKLLAYIKTSKENKPIKISFSSSGLKPVEIILKGN